MELHFNEIAFRGNKNLPRDVKNAYTIGNFQLFFFTNDLVDNIVMETNRCAHTGDINIFMSIFRYSKLESYWGEYGFRHIPNCMQWKKNCSHNAVFILQ